MRLWQSWQSGRFQCQMTLVQIQQWTFFVNQLLLLTVVKMIEGGRDLTIPMNFSRARNFARPRKMKNTGLPDAKN